VNVNLDATVGMVLLLGGAWFAGGPRWAGWIGILFGVVYLARALGAGKERDATGS